MNREENGPALSAASPVIKQVTCEPARSSPISFHSHRGMPSRWIVRTPSSLCFGGSTSPSPSPSHVGGIPSIASTAALDVCGVANFLAQPNASTECALHLRYLLPVLCLLSTVPTGAASSPRRTVLLMSRHRWCWRSQRWCTNCFFTASLSCLVGCLCLLTLSGADCLFKASLCCLLWRLCLPLFSRAGCVSDASIRCLLCVLKACFGCLLRCLRLFSCLVANVGLCDVTLKEFGRPTTSVWNVRYVCTTW